MKLSKMLFVAAASMPLALGAQQTKDTTAAAPAPETMPAPEFSGVAFGNYMYQTGKANGGFGGGANSFNFERAYLTLKEKLGDRTSVRVTTDVFPSGSGYQLRLKYGYLQYDYLKGADWNATARFGMIHNVYIDHEENFWPRWIAKTPTDLTGFFSSADLGAGTVITLPSKMGEVYALVSNGPGYTTTSDIDRFKDYSARLTLTPLSSSEGLLKTFDVSGWYYKGALAGNITPGMALDRDRWGIFAGIRDPRLTVGFDFTERKDQSQLTSTTDTSITGRILSGYVTTHPFRWLGGTHADCPLGVVLRYDQIKPNTDSSHSYSVYVAGLTYDLSKRASVSVDYQEQSSSNGPLTSLYLAAPKAVYMHMVLNY